MTLIICSGRIGQIPSILKIQNLDLKALNQFVFSINRQQCKTFSYHSSNNQSLVNSPIINTNARGVKLNHQNKYSHTGELGLNYSQFLYRTTSNLSKNNYDAKYRKEKQRQKRKLQQVLENEEKRKLINLILITLCAFTTVLFIYNRVRYGFRR